MSSKELQPREQAILTEIIEYYFAHHEAVSARTLSKVSRLALSPTSIRNLMEDLSDGGYLTPYGAPRGRVPTKKAFYVYIRGLQPEPRTRRPPSGMPAGTPAETRSGVPEPGGGEGMEPFVERLERAGSELARQTGCAAGVLLPAKESYPLDWVRFAPIAGPRVLVSVGTLFGDVWSRVVHAAEPIAPEVLLEVERHLDRNYRGRSLVAVRNGIMSGSAMACLENAPSLGGAFRLLRKAFEWGAEPQWKAWGEENLYRLEAFRDPERLLRLHRALQSPDFAERAVRQGSPVHGAIVAIGSETGARELADLSVVACTFGWEQGWQGILAAIGPIHMDYGKVLQIAAWFASELERGLKEAAGSAT